MALWAHHHSTDDSPHQTTAERKNPPWGPKLYLQQSATALEVISYILNNCCLRPQCQITFWVSVSPIYWTFSNTGNFLGVVRPKPAILLKSIVSEEFQNSLNAKKVVLIPKPMHLLCQGAAEDVLYIVPRAAVTQIHSFCCCSNSHHLWNPQISTIICPADRTDQNTYLYVLDNLWV